MNLQVNPMKTYRIHRLDGCGSHVDQSNKEPEDNPGVRVVNKVACEEKTDSREENHDERPLPAKPVGQQSGN